MRDRERIYITPSERTGQSNVENGSEKSYLASVRPPMAMGSNVLIFLITFGDNLLEKPWFVRVISARIKAINSSIDHF